MKKYSAAIIDDDLLCIKALKLEIDHNCPNIIVSKSYQDPRRAIEELPTIAYDILFLDIDMPWMNGFEFLKKYDHSHIAIVFTTAYSEFAIDAFRANAIDYLLKPIEPKPLIEAVSKAIQNMQSSKYSQNIEDILIKLTDDMACKTISIPTTNGFEFLQVDNIIYCKSDNNYCHIILDNDKPRLVSKTLKNIEHRLPKSFLRIHQSFLININHVRAYTREDGGKILLSNGDELPVSKIKKSEVLERLNDITG